MSKINIKVKQVKAANKELVNLASRVDGVGNRISSVRHQVDGRIVSRRNIGGNLNEAAAKVREAEKKLKKIHQFVDGSMNLYVKADKKADRFKEPEKKSVWDKMKDMFGTANDVVSGFRKGVAEAVFSTVEGIWNAITHPIETAKGIVYAVSHPVETAKSIWKSISDSWKNDVINGDAKSRSQWFGRAIGEVALAIIGTKGVDKAVKMAKGAKVVEEAGGVRIVKPGTIEKKDSGAAVEKRVTRGKKDNGVGIGKQEVLHKIDGKVGIGDNGKSTIIKDVKEVDFGNHIIKGKNGKKYLLPNTRYITDVNYKYTTDELGRIMYVNAPELILKKGERNKYAQATVGGIDRLPDDDGGHLIAAQFNGPGDIDNLVPQNSQINRRGGKWYEMEMEWANALKEIPPKKVSVAIEPHYIDNSLRPDKFKVTYQIEGELPVRKRIKNKSGG
ncbi:DNA/RNA non-specific endonuclease [Mesobacillus jeotgali]|uniref:DNA/RNA non-specific endonuclease n=1 Tax=Mesobacillus jeotgali TaxID=129985 RepID=UPI002148774B|nr:DNA/RNA non-specific endonuclease [Mesobacillus jeotgali]